MNSQKEITGWQMLVFLIIFGIFLLYSYEHKDIEQEPERDIYYRY